MVSVVWSNREINLFAISYSKKKMAKIVGKHKELESLILGIILLKQLFMELNGWFEEQAQRLDDYITGIFSFVI